MVAKPSPGKPWHQLVDHTAEVGLRVGAPSFGELLAEAARGLGDLLLPPYSEEEETGEMLVRRVEVKAGDREALLVDWLNELLFLAETESWVPRSVEIAEVSDLHLHADVAGLAVPEAPAVVKAATFHGLAIVESADGLTVEVILDV